MSAELRTTLSLLGDIQHLRDALRAEQSRANTWFEIAGNLQTERDALRTENAELRAALAEMSCLIPEPDSLGG